MARQVDGRGGTFSHGAAYESHFDHIFHLLTIPCMGMGNSIGSDRAPMLLSFFLLIFLFTDLSRMGMIFFPAHQCSVRILAYVCGLYENFGARNVVFFFCFFFFFFFFRERLKYHAQLGWAWMKILKPQDPVYVDEQLKTIPHREAVIDV